MKYLVSYFIYIVFILVPIGLVSADCNEEVKLVFEKILHRGAKNALPAVGLYYKNNDCVIQLAEGFSNLYAKTKIQKNDRFNVGRIAKMFVSVTSVKLAKLGVFSLDDNLQQWLPAKITDHIPKSNIITIRHLLSNTSGIVNYSEDKYFLDLVQPWTELDALQLVFDMPLLNEPGTEYEYSDTNYVLMGLIINQATTKPFATNIRELILEPLGLYDTFHLSEKNQYLEYVHGYGAQDGIAKLLDTHDIIKTTPFADGQMISSLSDLVNFIHAIFTNKTFMDDALLAILLSSPVVESHYKLGIEADYINGNVVFGHGGFEPGYETQLRYSPTNKETIVFFKTGTSLRNKHYNSVGEDDMTIYSNTYEYELQRAFRNYQKIQLGTNSE